MVSSELSSGRMQRKNRYITATLASFAAYAILVVWSLQTPILLWPAIAMSVVSMGLACLWVREIDEAAQQAHFISWFWGGSLGLGISVLVFLAVVARVGAPGGIESAFSFVPERLPASIGVFLGFVTGFVLGCMPAVIGYVVWWSVLSLRRR
jgi:hypothetical protein